MKIAVVTCYDQNDYVRARTLRTAVAAVPDAYIFVIRNNHKGLLRYMEVPLKILKARFREKPDAYVITFRGYEMLLYMVLTLVRKPIIFDEMVNFTEWMTEHKVIKEGTLSYRLFRWWYGRLARHAALILADTDVHAAYSGSLNQLALDRYRSIPVGTDETVFFPQQTTKPDGFTVFYYGHMLPLHGLRYVLDAAVMLKENPDITFRIIGGKAAVSDACEQAVQAGARVIHEDWLAFEKLPQAASQANLTLGGPFGDTVQSQHVITGKTYQFLALGAPVLLGKNKVDAGFKDKVNCLMVSQADAKAIAEAIDWAYAHPDELQKIGMAGRRLYEQHFSQKVINDSINKLVQELEHD